MARAPANVVGECYYGPGHVSAGTLKFAINGRYVYQNQVIGIRPATLMADAYFTYNGIISTVGVDSELAGVITLDYNLADRWDFPLLGVFYQTVYWTDVVAPGVRPAYRRVHIGPSWT